MLMRDPEGIPLDQGRMSRRRKLRVTFWSLCGLVWLLIGAAALAFALGDDSSGESNAPWISGGSKGDYSLDDYIWAAVAGLLTAFVLAVMSSAIRLIRSRKIRSESQSGSKKTAWRYREMSRREKRILSAALMLSCSIAGVPLAQFGLDGDRGDVFIWPFVAATLLGTLTGLGMALVQVRPSRTVMQIVEDRAERELTLKLERLRAEDAQKMDEWKNETVAELLAMIMDQVNRGVITCGNCPEGEGEEVRPAPEEARQDAPASTGTWKPKGDPPAKADNQVFRAIGQALRSARIESNQSVDDIAADARMRRQVVLAIEKGHLGVFGGDMSARAHIRVFANQVGLAPRPLLRQYEEGKRRAA